MRVKKARKTTRSRGRPKRESGMNLVARLGTRRAVREISAKNDAACEAALQNGQKIVERINPVTGKTSWIKLVLNPSHEQVREAEIILRPLSKGLTPKQRREYARRVAVHMFAKPVSGGRPKGTEKWTHDALFKLGAKLHEIEAEGPRTRRTSNVKWAELIKSRWPEDYQHEPNLRKWLPKARRVFEAAGAGRRRAPLS
jgi:hypothetical protein